MSRIGIFGGSFNPVHNGHVLAAREYIRVLQLDTLLVIPTCIPPHKSLSDSAPSGEVRGEFLRLAMQEIPQAVVDEMELRRHGVSYTYETITELRSRYPDDDLFLLMGTDMFLSFREWNYYEEILRMVSLGVIHRTRLSHEENSHIVRLADELQEQYGARIFLLDTNYIDLSSTTVRRMLMLDCAEALLPAAVYSKIQNDGLYGRDGGYKNLPFQQLVDAVRPLYDARRFQHAVGCGEIAAELAKHYGANAEDAARAGLLHDITKVLSAREQLQLCQRYAIMTDEYCGDQTKLLHGKTAAAAARHIFGENEAVCQAISWHTTGRSGMSMLEKIIYIADYVEPNRCFEGVSALRELAFEDLNAAVRLGIQTTIDTLIKNNRTLNKYSLEALEYLKLEGILS